MEQGTHIKRINKIIFETRLEECKIVGIEESP